MKIDYSFLSILIMFDVKLTPSDRSVDRLPICMNG